MGLFTKTDVEMERYVRIRECAVPLMSGLVETLPRKLIVQAARDLGMMSTDDSKIFLTDKSDSDYLMDRAIHDIPWPQERWIEKICRERLSEYSPEEQNILLAHSSSYFSLYEMVSRDPGRGVVLRDLFQPREFLLMDKGLGRTAYSLRLMATRVIELDGLYFSAGASAIFEPDRKSYWMDLFKSMFEQRKGTLTWEMMMRQYAYLFIQEFLADEAMDFKTEHVTPEMQNYEDSVVEEEELEFAPPRPSPEKLGRNDPCHCGSGKKYKKCCLSKDEKSRPKERFFERAAKHHLIHSSDQFPVERCLINENWKDSRLAQIVVTREFEPGQLLYGVYLVDLGCMGVKSSFCNVGYTVEELESGLMAKLFSQQTMVPTGIQYAKEIVEGALNYADALGLKPDPDFELAKHVLGKEPVTTSHGVKFGGDDGKPLFVAGPHDDANQIIKQLRERLGEDGFNFIAPVNMGSE